MLEPENRNRYRSGADACEGSIESRLNFFFRRIFRQCKQFSAYMIRIDGSRADYTRPCVR